MTEVIASVVQGLSEEEAQRRRRQGLGNEAQVKTGRSYFQIVRENLFTFFNIVLLSLAAALLILDSPRDALFTGAIALLNAVIATVQEIRAKRKLDAIALLTRPTAKVIRNGIIREIDPAEVVLGDLLTVGPGDQVVADGVIVGGLAEFDESLLTGESNPVPKQAGDPVYSGSFVLSGEALYEAQKVGLESFVNKLAAGARQFTRELTPLQREVNLFVRILLVLVAYFGVAIAANFLIMRDAPLLQSVQAASVVFGLAPASLFLMIVVAYALGAVRIADKGALVQQANAVESLCHVDVLCLDKTGTLTTNRMHLKRIEPLRGHREGEVRRWLGTYVRSLGAANATTEAIVAACEGEAAPPCAIAPFSSARQWSGLTFDLPSLRGTFVLGAPEILQPALDQSDDAWRNEAHLWALAGHRILLFAAAERPLLTFGEAGEPRLPPRLTPLALLVFVDELRPEARTTLEGFRRAGVAIKIISGDNPHTVAAVARQVGFGEDGAPLRLISGPELELLDEAAFKVAVVETDIFGRITPEQKQRIVRALRAQGHYVGMTGDGVNDVLALKQANLGIAMQSGAQATRNVAGLVLLNDSFEALPQALMEGQRIMHGMEDTLRLYLTRIFTLAILINSLALLSAGFPYTPAQNSMIAIFSLTIPAFFLTLWAPTGAVPRGSLVRKLVNFVLPATIVTSFFSLTVYLYFLLTTENWPYAQLILTYASIVKGLLLVIFVQPPTEFWAGGDRLSGDRRPTMLALGLLVVLLSSPYNPPLRSFFGLSPLRSLTDGLIVAGFALTWIVTLRLVWKWRIVDRYLDVNLADWESSNRNRSHLQEDA